MQSLLILDDNKYPARKKSVDFGNENCTQSHLLSYSGQQPPQGGYGCGQGGNCGGQGMFQGGIDVQGDQQGGVQGEMHGFCPQQQLGRKDTHLPIR